MKEAISAGWKVSHWIFYVSYLCFEITVPSNGWKTDLYNQPGQSFSFVAKNLKGQQLQDQDVTGASPIGGGTSLM